MTHKMLINKFIKTGSSLLVQVLKIHRMSECELVQFQVSPVSLKEAKRVNRSYLDLYKIDRSNLVYSTNRTKVLLTTMMVRAEGWG